MTTDYFQVAGTTTAKADKAAKKVSPIALK